MTTRHIPGLVLRTGGSVWEILLLFLALSATSKCQGEAAVPVNVEAADVVQQQQHQQQHQQLSPTTDAQVPAMFVFGDSIVDAGTNSLFPSLVRANFKPYGTQYFGRPTGRWTNGRTYADFLATYLGLPFAEPYLKRKGKWSVLNGVNYASGGSGFLRSTNEMYKVIPYPDQILQFGQTELKIANALSSKAAAARLFSKSLFLINIGSNDLLTYALNASANASTPQKQFLDDLLKALDDSVKVLYQAGARKFIFIGVPTLGCEPGILAVLGIQDGNCYDAINVFTKVYNAALEDYVYDLPKSFPAVKAIVGKPFNELLRFITDGGPDGFDAGVSACCGSGIYNAAVQCGRPADLITNPKTTLCDDVDRHVYWDNFHPTDRAYELISELLWSGNSSYVAPFNVKTLASS